MPVNVANSSDQAYDFACLRRRFRGKASSYNWLVRLPTATSDDAAGHDDERDLELLREAISSSTDTISYEQFREELGLH